MRKVLDAHREVAHVWAAQSQPEGRAGNMFFEGPSIFSYGHHFEIARIIQPQDVVLFTTRGYSSSTAKHKSHTRGAVSHKTVFHVPSFTDHAENAQHYLKLLDELRVQVVRSRTSGEFLRGSLEREIAEAAAYVQVFRVPAKLKNAIKKWSTQQAKGKLFSPEELVKIKDQIRKKSEADKNKAERQHQAREAQRVEDLEKLDAWASGGSNDLPGWSPDLPTRLRVKDNQIQTSRGAKISLGRAIELWDRLITGQSVEDMDLDGYTVNSWDGQVLKVGCHLLTIDELSKIARGLGLKELGATV